MSYTKLDGTGNALPDSAMSWVTVKDNVTGLIWEMKTNKDGVKNYNDPHDADNTYTWYDSNPATNGGNSGTPGNGTDTEDFIKALNDAHYGGYSDWHLPTIKELGDIVEYSIPNPGPMIDPVYFPDNYSSFYWSSTTVVGNSSTAWLLDFGQGFDGNYNGKGDGYVRAVRGGQSGTTGSYKNNNDGTVTDTNTSLMWQQDGSSYKTWEQALAYCEDLSLGGYADWRLPTSKELRSIVDNSRYNPAINTTYFPNTAASWYWSSTTFVYYTPLKWGVHFDYGNANGGSNYNADFSYVRAVRGGQSSPNPICAATLDSDLLLNIPYLS
jgi:hypothetical protein